LIFKSRVHYQLWLSDLKEGFADLFAAKLRAILTMLGVLVGTAAVVALISGGELATAHALAQFKQLGTDLLALRLEDSAQARHGHGSSPLTWEDLEKIKNASPDILLMAPYSLDYVPFFYHGQRFRGTLIGATRGLQKILGIKMEQGRFISRFDQHAFFGAMGKELEKNMRKISHEKLLGSQVRVGGDYVTLVGLMQSTPDSFFLYIDPNRSLMVPLDTAFLLGNHRTANQIVFKLKPKANIEKVKKILCTFSKFPKESFSMSPINPGTFLTTCNNLSRALRKVSRLFSTVPFSVTYLCRSTMFALYKIVVP